MALFALVLLFVLGSGALRLAAGSSSPSRPLPVFVPLVLASAFGAPPPVTPPPTGPTWSTPIALSPDGTTIWVVNPDSNTVSVLDARTLSKSAELSTGREPWSLAISPDGSTVYVANRASGTLSVFDARSRVLVRTVPVGAEPGAIALTPDGSSAIVTLMTEGAALILDTSSLLIRRRAKVAAAPFALAVDGPGKFAYITHLIAQPLPNGQQASNDGNQGLVTVLEINTGQVVDTIPLLPNDFGFPNRLSGITIAGNRAWLAHLRATPELPNRATTTVFAALLSLDLDAQREDTSAFVPLNDQQIFGSPVNNPAVAVPSPDGTHLYVVLSGSDLVEVVNVADPHNPQLVKFLATGHNPHGLVLTSDGSRAFVMNYLSRSVSVLDLVKLEVIAEIPSTNEVLSANLLRGKLLFNTATDPRLTQGGWVSCASCHFEGWPDGVTWRFPDGPRQTPMLWNANVTLPWHWSAALDEAQDVEDTIHAIQGGLGLAPGRERALLGTPNAGRTPDLDALATFLNEGLRVVSMPNAPESASGRAVFAARGCAACHGGAQWTASQLPDVPGTMDADGDGSIDSVLHDVGTFNPLDVRGARGFDVPSLLGVGLTAPYLHDGSAPTLEALLLSGHPTPAEPFDPGSDADFAALIDFLRSIAPTTAPIEP